MRWISAIPTRRLRSLGPTGSSAISTSFRARFSSCSRRAREPIFFELPSRIPSWDNRNFSINRAFTLLRAQSNQSVCLTSVAACEYFNWPTRPMSGRHEVGTPSRTLHMLVQITWRCGRRPHELTETIMRRVLVIAAASIALGACTNFSLPSFEMPSMTPTPAASTVEFESEPAGADVKTSTGQTCRTPCALSVAATDLTATFTLNGYQAQSIPVRMATSSEGRDPNTGQVAPPRMTPNPVYAELMIAPQVRRPAPPPAASKPAAKKKPKAAAKPKPPADPMSAAPAQTPASPWPAPSPTR